jgi:hypothetical protein
MDAERIVRIQAAQIKRLEGMVEKLIGAMDRQNDMIGRLVAIAMTPETGDDVEDQPQHRYLSAEDDPRHRPKPPDA